MVNFSEEEINEIANEAQKSLDEERDNSKIQEFLTIHKINPVLSINDMIGKTFTIEGADISIRNQGFTLYTKDYNIYGTFMDGCVILMNEFLLKYFKTNKNISHRQYAWDGHFYIYPNEFKIKVNQKGKLFKRYSFEVVA